MHTGQRLFSLGHWLLQSRLPWWLSGVSKHFGFFLIQLTELLLAGELPFRRLAYRDTGRHEQLRVEERKLRLCHKLLSGL